MCGICGVIRSRAIGSPALAGGTGPLGPASDAGPPPARSADEPGGAPASLPPAAEPLVRAMIRALSHRGPDEVGIRTAAAASLGATRLAIRGIASGHQPIVDAETGVTVVCNGEIDNSAELRRWLEARGRDVPMAADVAVLHGLYLERGERFVEELAGAFAIGLWDPREELLLLARDRAGERPLFYIREPEGVRFATEIAALATDPSLTLTPDPETLRWFLRFGSFRAPGSPFREIRKVAPAEIVLFRRGEETRRRYWRWSIVGSAKREPALEVFDRVFREAVRRQSEVEVDYGVFLSGGIDSSLVAAVARRERPERRVRAFTLRFAEPSFDEGDYAGRVARLLGCEPVEVWVRPEDLPEGLSYLVRQVGEPLADPAWIPTALLARRAAEDVKLCLVGEGADELFGGYPTYLGVGAAAAYRRWPAWLRRAVRRAVMAWPPSDKKVTLSFLLKRFVAGDELDEIARHFLWVSNLSPELLRRLGAEVAEPPTLAREAPEIPPNPSATETGAVGLRPDRPLDLVQRIDLEYFLGEGLLTKADRASMQSALELRAPFLDAAVMEFAATLPGRARVRGLTTKVFLKRYAERYLPREIVHRKKRGLSVPLGRWLRGPLHDWAASRISDPRLADAGVDPAAAGVLLAEHDARRADHARAIWTLVVLVEWLRWVEERAGAGSRRGEAAR